MDGLQFDPQGAFVAGSGITREAVAALAPKLEAARRETLDDVAAFNAAAPVPKEKDPLDAGFLEMPERILAEFRQRREASELGRILATARRLRDEVDRVVVLGIGGSYMGARALFESCCQPYHNELTRADRGGAPRLYFSGNNVDNDRTSALLELLGQGTDRKFAVVVVSKSGGTLETAVAFRLFAAALAAAGGDPRDAIVPVTGRTGRLRELSAAIGCRDVFDIPEGVGGRFSILSAVGLMPAALLGLDVVALLEGAAAMNARFREAPPGDNPPLDYTAVAHVAEEHGRVTRVLSVWSDELEAVGLWYDQLLAESLGKHQRGALPLTVVNTRDLHSRGQQHQEGRLDKLITNLIVDQPRRDPLVVPRSAHDQDQLNRLAGRTLPEFMSAAVAGTNQAYAEVGRPTIDLRLPRLDEATMGQFFQMMMLATVVEGRLIGINPYGQPGVEAYKRNMQALLARGASNS